MAAKQGGGKKKRTSRKSKGVNGAGGKGRPTDLELALMGKGPFARSAELMRARSAR